ncbi:uncharacterized mitochondrial protein AtMg00810-like [Nicotiana tomentosiformis]|uniref:uncharacterized mitochondrial protein AtMg00810-like n=1 Tax=Nicotiana tomentosiformis TaxID=4098 RepID=UPI00388C368C
MEELTYFLGLQINQSLKGIFISQTKYIKELIKKFGMENAKPIGTPMSPTTMLNEDNHGKCVDETMYRGMIGSLLYLTASRPDIMFSVCDKIDRKSTSGTCQLLGNALVSWHSKKQNCVALSITEAKYLAIESCCDIALEFISTKSQFADIFTKPLLEERFCLLQKKIDIITAEISPQKSHSLLNPSSLSTNATLHPSKV